MEGKLYKVRYIGIDSQEIYYENYTTEFKGYEALEKNKEISPFYFCINSFLKKV